MEMEFLLATRGNIQPTSLNCLDSVEVDILYNNLLKHQAKVLEKGRKE